MLKTFNALYRYRAFIHGSVKREFQVRYRTSMLGAAWLVLQPLAMIVVYTVIFAEVMRSKLSGVDGTFAYSIYLCSGVLTWGLFTEMLIRAQGVFIENAGLLKKLNFPKICLPAIIALSSTFNFLIIFFLFVIFLVVSGNFPGIVFLAIFPVLLLQVAFAMGLGISLGVLNVFFRDVGQLINIVIQFWFWLTPVVYPAKILPLWAHKWMVFNPMAAIIVSYQDIFVYKQWPNWTSLLPAFGVTLFFIGTGFLLFRKHAADMVDEL